jgi:hypothetical protein
MRIVTSTIIAEHVQRDGRRDITERHVTDTGETIDVHYRADAKADVRRTMRNRVAVIEAQLAERAAREAEQAALEARRDEVIKRLPVANVADVLMVDEAEASRLKDRADTREVSRG